MSQDDYIPFAEIVSELGRLCSGKQTGVLYLKTEANRSAQIMLNEGEIVFINFFNKRGNDAIKLLAETSAGRSRFQEGSISSRPMDLPPTSEILQSLAGNAQVTKQQGSPRVQEKASPAPSSSGKSGALTVTERRLLEESLAPFIGPMATIVCEEHLDSVSDVHAAVEALAAEIPSEEQAEQFRAEVLKNLG